MRLFIGLLLFTFIVLPLGMAALILLSVNSWVLDRDFYLRLMDDPALYENLLEQDLPSYFNNEVFPASEAVPSAALTAALREVVTPEYVRDQATTIVNQVFDSLESVPPAAFDIAFDLRPIKTALQGEKGTAFANTLASKLPACEPGQSARPPSAILPVCVPPDTSPETLAANVVERLPRIIQDIPNDYPVDRNVIIDSQTSGMTLTGATLREVLTVAVGAVAALAAFFWLITALIGGRSTRGIFIGLGTMLFIVAGLTVASGFGLMTALVGPYARSAVVSTNLNVGTQQAVTSFIDVLGGQIGSSFLVTGGVALAVALGLFLIGIFTSRRDPDDYRKTVVIG